MPTRIIDVCSVPLAKTVGTNVGISQVITDDLEMFLNCPLCYWEQPLIWCDVMQVSIVTEVIVDCLRHGEDPFFACFLLCDIQPQSLTIPYEIGKTKSEDVSDSHTEIRLCGQNRSYPLIRPEGVCAILNGTNDLLVLILCKCYHAEYLKLTFCFRRNACPCVPCRFFSALCEFDSQER